MKAFRNVLDKVLELICCTLLVFMTCTATWQVVSRYVFKSPSTWSESVTLICFVWTSLLSAAYVFGKQEHMRMTFLFDKFSLNAQKTIEILTEIIILLFAVGVLVVGGFNISMLEMGQKEATLGIAVGYIYLALPISGVITCLYNVLNLSEIKEKYALKSKEETSSNKAA